MTMRNNSDHAMFPTATHDEQAAQGFVKTLRVFSTRNFLAANGALLRDKGLSNADAAPSRRDLREALEDEPENQWWSAMLRTTQEVLYDTVGPTIERQLPDLIDRANAMRGKLGSLTLDESVEVPPYLAAVDMHCKPGSYQQEMVPDDVFAGAEFDRTFRLYSMGGLGPNLDDMGHTLIAWLRNQFGETRPKRILDMGCTVGHSTLPYCDVFPDAEVHAIDVAATCLRYAHARAIAMGKEVHFSQQNAEHTNFEDGSFDLVVSHVMMHETSRRAIRAIFKECHRLLAPGGIMIHMDGICPSDPLQKYYADWQAVYNNEPYLGTVQDEDFMAISTQAGFSADNVTLSEAVSQFQTGANDDRPVRSYQVVCAQK
jgi:ubiquinone/menaquinone biosynthesis C-methylase UbiE